MTCPTSLQYFKFKMTPLLVLSIFTVLFRFCIGIEELNLLQRDQKKLNVILFFTNVDDSNCMVLRKDALGCLGLHEKARIQSCEESNKSDDLENEETNQKVCKENLEKSLTTLTHFCHTVMKMKTALASVSNKEMASKIQEFNIPFRTSDIESDSNFYRSKRFDNNNWKNAQTQINRFSNDKKPKSTVRNVITGNKHTEVFQIRIKRKAGDDENFRKTEFDEEPPKEQTNKKYNWDVLDIMRHIRYSFLGKLFDNDQNGPDQEHSNDIPRLGKLKQDPGLFNMVNQTLHTLLEPPENPFLMIIFGGHLNTITDNHSALVQSIKHVIENTEDEETLIMVTGSCTEKPRDPDKDHERGTFTMPLYAKGPGSDVLSECTLLYDIPLAISRILKKHTGIGAHFAESIGT